MTEFVNKILAYGCSFTYGDSVGIEHAWPKHLGDLFNVPVTNRGLSGGSNKLAMNRLFEDITQTEYAHTLVVFSWTGIQRTTFYDDEYNQWIPLLVGHEPPDPKLANKSKLYFKYLYTDYDAMYTYYTQQLSVQAFLEARNIEYLFINAFKEDYIFYDDNSLGAMRSSINKEKFVYGYENTIYNQICIKDKLIAIDGFHPSEEGHQAVAKEIYNHYHGVYNDKYHGFYK